MLGAIASRIFCLRRSISAFDPAIDSGAALAIGDGVEEGWGDTTTERDGSGERGEAATVVFGRGRASIVGDSVLECR